MPSEETARHQNGFESSFQASIGLARVFDEDHDLGRWLDEPTLAKARRQVVTDTYEIARGAPLPERLVVGPAARQPSLCLILDGFVVNSIHLGGRRGLAIIGPGDLFSPWQGQRDAWSVPYEEAWYALARTRIALLDEHFQTVCGRLPGVASELLERSVRSARALAIHRAVSQLPSLRRRLLVLLWYVADRWGRVTPDGVVIPLKLPHDVLADLVGARRPSVTIALNELIGEGCLSREARGEWHLHGAPPAITGELISLVGLIGGGAAEGRESVSPTVSPIEQI